MTHLRFENESDWIAALVAGWQETGSQALQKHGSFKVALSGGSSPESFYRALTKIDWPWSATTLYIGDERWVPADHPDSNYRMIYQAFYPLKIKIERWKTEAPKAEDAALDYERRLIRELGQPPRFDLVLLGIGNDGHTASLFPNTKALQENNKFATTNWVPQINGQRLTLTYPTLYQAKQIWFLSKGAGKQQWINRMEEGKSPDFPAANVTCEKGEIKIYNCVS